MVLYWLWGHPDTVFALHPPKCLIEAETNGQWASDTFYLPLVWVFSHAIVQVLVQGVTDVDLWIQPGGSPACCSFATCLQTSSGEQNVYSACCSVCVVLSCPHSSPARVCSQSSETLNITQANEYVRFHLSVQTTARNQAFHPSFNCLMLLVFNGLCRYWFIAMYCSLCFLTAKQWYLCKPRLTRLVLQCCNRLWSPKVQAPCSHAASSPPVCCIPQAPGAGLPLHSAKHIVVLEDQFLVSLQIK